MSLSHPPVPATMVAATVPAPGGPDAIRFETLSVPQPGPGDILVRVLACGVNRPDVMQRKGLYPPPPGAHPGLGLEVAGIVAACGEPLPGQTMPEVGARVCALTNGGGYAEYALVPAAQSLPWPDGFNAVEAAALPETFFTVWSNLFMPAFPAPGSRVLIHGGSSGIGTAAIQLVRSFGGIPYVTAGTAKKCALCEKLGAIAINYREEDFAERLRELTDKKGVNIILDMVGGGYLERNLRSLSTDGRLVIIALQSGSKAPDADLTRIMTQRLTITGSALRKRSPEAKAQIAQQLQQHVWPLLASGEITPLIHTILPLSQAAQAHEEMESGNHSGKIILTTEESPQS